MNKKQKEVELAKLEAEAKELKHLKAIYSKAADDISKKLEISNGKINVLLKDFDELDDVQKSILQSQIYQRNFQLSLKKQIDGFMKELNSGQYESIDQYLKGCYETGFLGAMYDIHGQGIPIISPIDQKQVIKAKDIDSKISKKLYTKLGEDVDVLKKRIANNISRGIATADSYSNIARNISSASNVGFNNAMRIARTEGHRIQAAAAFDAQHKAKDEGADIVKQWDSTLDGKTRDTHRMLDGQIRELDEPFEVYGHKARFPSDFGMPSEDINCRCALLQRARWVLDEDELETLKERAAYYGLDKTESFQDFQKKYIKAAVEAEGLTEINYTDFAYGDYSNDDYIKWMDEYDEHNKGVKLSADELKIIDDYTEGSFIALNDVSRYSESELLKKGYSAEDIARIKKKAELLEGALSKYDLDTDIVTHRFERDVSWLTGKGNDIADLESLIGKEYTAEGFTSSGMLPNRFRFTGGKSDAVHFEIETPKGTNGAFLSMSKKGENEFLYNRNTRFKVIDGGERVVKEMKFNIKTMQMEEVEIKERFLKVLAVPSKPVNVATKANAAKVVAATKSQAANKVAQPAVNKTVFVPAKSIGEAEEYIKKHVDSSGFGATGISYSGISVESANAVNEALEKLYDRFNMDKLGGVYVAKGNTKLGKAIDGATAAYSPIRKSLLINNKSLKNPDVFLKSRKEELEIIKKYKEDPSSYTFRTKRAEDVAKASLISGRATVPDTVEDVINHEMGHSIEKIVAKADGYETVKANMSKYADKISGYATINESEYIAESFASYLKGEGLIDPNLEKIFKGLERNS